MPLHMAAMVMASPLRQPAMATARQLCQAASHGHGHGQQAKRPRTEAVAPRWQSIPRYRAMAMYRGNSANIQRQQEPTHTTTSVQRQG